MGIKQIGVELEGRWNTEPQGFTSDGSVRGFSTYGYVGEVPSPVLTLAEVNSWLEANYPDEVNASCGMHVHISVDEKVEYSLLMSHAARLENDLIENVFNWAKEREIIPNHPLWARLRGENTYCQQGTGAVVEQTRARRKMSIRYRMLNFCYSLHGTVEIRLLPGFKKKHLGIEAVNVVIDTVNNALTSYQAIPKELIRETTVGTIECHAWKQGFTCFLDTSAQLKKEIYEKIYGRYNKPRGTDMLARLLRRDRVTIPVMTESALDTALTNSATILNNFRVTLSDIREESN